MLFSTGSFLRIMLSGFLATATLSLSSLVPADAHVNPGVPLAARYADALGAANSRLPRAVRRDLAERVLLLSSYYKLDPCLLGALVSVESAWRSRAVSPVGAIGYGQLMPGTAATLDVNALEPYENLDGTARYLRRMLNRFAGRDVQTRMQLALASYNAGPAAVSRYHGIPPYRETRAYVRNVLRTRLTFVAAVEAPRTSTQMAMRDHRRPQTPHWLGVPNASIVAVETPPAVRYETSRSFVARFLGLRHHVASTPMSTPASVTTGVGRGPRG